VKPATSPIKLEDLKSLDKYRWSGHSTILGYCKNPLIPEAHDQKPEARNETKDNSLRGRNELNSHELTANISSALEQKSLSEKTVEDVLQYFGKSLKKARLKYRQFVENGIKQGTREDLQGGGLIRSSGGDKSMLLGLSKEEREKGDARILGSGDFVSTTLEQSERIFEKKYLSKRPIEELVEAVAGKLGLKPELICSGNRQRQYSEARSLVALLAVEEIGHPAAEVARFLGISRVGVLLSLEKAKEICRKYEFELTPFNLSDSIC